MLKKTKYLFFPVFYLFQSKDKKTLLVAAKSTLEAEQFGVHDLTLSFQVFTKLEASCYIHLSTALLCLKIQAEMSDTFLSIHHGRLNPFESKYFSS